MVRRCLACGKSGHRLDGCKSKAAVEIRRLRKELQSRHRDNSRANPGRKNRKSGQKKKAAKDAYTKKSVRKSYLKRRAADPDGSWKKFRKEISDVCEDPMQCWEQLKKLGFLNEPTCCLACGRNKLQAAVVDPSSPVVTVYLQCGHRACRSKNHVVNYGVFRGLRVSCEALLAGTVQYCGLPYMKAPNVRTLQMATWFGRSSAEHFVDALASLEVKAGQDFSKRLKFAQGDLEIDATALRSFFLSPKNPNYQAEIYKYVKNHGGKKTHEALRAHARVLGITERGELLEYGWNDSVCRRHQAGRERVTTRHW